MKPSQMVKSYGLGSLRNVAKLTGKSERTLINWFNDMPELFEIVLLGCTVKVNPKEESIVNP